MKRIKSPLKKNIKQLYRDAKICKIGKQKKSSATHKQVTASAKGGVINLGGTGKWLWKLSLRLTGQTVHLVSMLLCQECHPGLSLASTALKPSFRTVVFKPV